MSIPEGEWILTSGTGGYALGRGDFLNTRKYHSLLVAPCCGRRINFFPAIEEKIVISGGEFFLDSNHYPGAIFPTGFEYIKASWLRPYPAVVFTLPGNISILKEVLMAEGMDAVVVRYRNLHDEPLKFELRPKVAMRDHHSLNAPGSLHIFSFDIFNDDGWIGVKRDGIKGYLFCKDCAFIQEKLIYKNVLYPTEAMRGYDSSEDLFSPGRIDAIVKPGETIELFLSTQPFETPELKDYLFEKKYVDFPQPQGKRIWEEQGTIQKHEYQFDLLEYKKLLKLMGEDFLCCRNDIIAGYPWFSTWGRDAMISLGGVKHLPGGDDFARRVLIRYGRLIKDGIIPNFIDENGEPGGYNTVDAPLWFVIRASEFVTQDLVEDFFKFSAQIIVNYAKNKKLKFFLDEDGLIKIRRGNFALTWMDAMVWGKPVTPRWGKPVEINALWVNALNTFLELWEKAKKDNKIYSEGFYLTKEEIVKILKKAKRSMKKFVTEDGVADRLDEENRPVEEVRPNMVIAASLPVSVFSKDVNRRVLQIAKEKLLTDAGLRTLSPDHPAFRKAYIGNQRQRDLAYHQGSVWPFLLLFYGKLLEKVESRQKAKEQIEELLWFFREKVMQGEYASIPELYDGENPTVPRGAPAQAWSVFAIIELEEMLKR